MIIKSFLQPNAPESLYYVSKQQLFLRASIQAPVMVKYTNSQGFTVSANVVAYDPSRKECLLVRLNNSNFNLAFVVSANKFWKPRADLTLYSIITHVEMGSASTGKSCLFERFRSGRMLSSMDQSVDSNNSGCNSDVVFFFYKLHIQNANLSNKKRFVDMFFFVCR